jgi:hypothetical protein
MTSQPYTRDRASAAADAVSPGLADPDGRLDRLRRALDRGTFDGVGVSAALDDRNVRLRVCLLRARQCLGHAGKAFRMDAARRRCNARGRRLLGSHPEKGDKSNGWFV